MRPTDPCPGFGTDDGPALRRVSPVPDLSPPRDVLSGLRARIRAIERSGTSGGPTVPCERRTRLGAVPPPAWRLGAAPVDSLLGVAGLELAGVHEIKPEQGQGAVLAAAARSFALALAVRRHAAGDPRAAAPILWCEPRASRHEHGALYGPGLADLGIDPARLVLVEPARTQDVLWAMEEGLAAGALSLVAGVVDEADLTPARRLALAAARGGTPCLLLTHQRTGPAAATATRWRVGARPGAPHPLDPAAPGAARFALSLERCRAHPPGVSPTSVPVEWSNVAYRFRMAADVADRAHGDRSRPGPRAVAGRSG